MIRSQQFILPLSLIFISLFTIACGVVPPQVSLASVPQKPKSEKLESYIDCDNANDKCTFVVTAGPLGQDKKIQVRLEADAGILFGDNHVVHEKDYDDYGRYKASESEAVALNGQGRRTFFFPIHVGSEIPGEYIIRASLLDADTNELLHEDRPKAFLVHTQNGVSLVATKQEFDTHYAGYQKGKLGLSYRLILAEGERPKKGTLYIMVLSNEENYHPNITIETKGGVTVKRELGSLAETGADYYIDTGGCRILAYTVEIDDAALPVPGTFVFEVAVQAFINGQQMIGSEDTPVAVTIEAHSNDPLNRWLGTTIVPVSDVKPFTPTGIMTVQENRVETAVADNRNFSLIKHSEQSPPPIAPSFLEEGVADTGGIGGMGGGNLCLDLELLLQQYDGNQNIAHQQLVVNRQIPITKFDFDYRVAQCGLK